MNVEFRRAGPPDLSRLYPLEKEAFPDAAWPRDVFEEALAEPSNEFQMALREGRPVGYILLNHASGGPGTVCVDSLAVAKDTRGQKIGEQLLLRGLETAHEQGCDAVRLQVEQGNVPAEKLYAKYGFVPTKVLSEYYGPGRDGTEMELKPLDAARLRQHRQELQALLGGFPSRTSVAS